MHRFLDFIMSLLILIVFVSGLIILSGNCIRSRCITYTLYISAMFVILCILLCMYTYTMTHCCLVRFLYILVNYVYIHPHCIIAFILLLVNFYIHIHMTLICMMHCDSVHPSLADV